MKRYIENSFSDDEIEVLPQNDLAYDLISEYFKYVLHRDGSGNIQTMTIAEFRDFVDVMSGESEGRYDYDLDWDLDAEYPDFIIRQDGKRVYDAMSLIYDAEEFEENTKGCKNMKKFHENFYEKDIVTIKPTDFFPQDTLAEYCYEELDKDTDGKNVEMTISELRDFYEWTQEFEEDSKIDWESETADYEVYEGGERVHDIMSLIYDSFEENKKLSRKAYREGLHDSKTVTVKPTDFFPQDVLSEFCSDELDMDTDGREVEMSIDDLREFYDWTKGFDSDTEIFWHGPNADYKVYMDDEKVSDVAALISGSYKENKKSFRKPLYEDMSNSDMILIKPSDFYPQDVLAEYCSDELDMDTDGRNVKMTISELRDFYDWTQEFDDDGKIIWDGDEADYKVYEDGEQVYDIMSLVYDSVDY